MKMKCLLYIVVLLFSLEADSIAFDNKVTHITISKSAINKSSLDSYVTSVLGLPTGIKTRYNGIEISTFLQIGSDVEDAPNCRAANHFHNPLLPWDQSYSSDVWPQDVVCRLLGWTPRYSNITWATGYNSPDDSSNPASPRNLQDMGWDNARQYFHNALTATDAPIREAHFAKSFQALGQTLHLLQDMAVPAHVRNDFLSHLIFAGINPGGVTNWVLNPFETYVRRNPNLVSSISDVQTYSIIGAKTSDFWDTDNRGSAPFSQGLAESTNAGYFSDFTIPGNPHIPFVSSHTFPSPQVPIYTCSDNIPGTNDKRKYASRWPCPTNGGSVDHLAAISMFTPRLLGLPPLPLPFFNKYALDDNVHKTYAGELLPRTVGYSAALLNYFFRGTIKVEPVSTSATTITVSAKNTTTNGDAMTGGTLDLVLRYRSVGDPDQLFKIIPFTDYQYLDIKLPSNQTIDATTKEFTFDLSATPLPDWANEVTAWLVYRGQLGNEADAVAVGKTELKTTPRKMLIALPADGVYGETDGSTGFTQITVAATANIPGLDLADGLIELVLIHRTSDSDPFQGTPVTTSPANPLVYHYIRASEETGTTALVQGQKTELTFDISDNPLPVRASDVYMYISYKKAGDPDSKSMAVGFLDISEPTPVDAFNNTDYTCLNNSWYRYDDPAAMALADKTDIYPHTISNITFQGGPANAVTLSASPQQNNLAAAGPLQLGQMLRLGYILTDYANRYAFDEQWTNITAQDSWATTSSTTTFSGVGFVNQSEMGLSSMYTMRGKLMGWGASVIYVNDPYPANSICDTDLLNQPAP